MRTKRAYVATTQRNIVKFILFCLLKPRPHQQQCPSNIVQCYKLNDSFDNVECCFDIVAVCCNKVECCFDKVERSFDNVHIASTLLLVVWTGLYRTKRHTATEPDARIESNIQRQGHRESHAVENSSSCLLYVTSRHITVFSSVVHLHCSASLPASVAAASADW